MRKVLLQHRECQALPARVSQTIGISTVTVKYSRPSVKNREIWGALVPYGYNVQAFGCGQ
jgi:hypothetical protein